MQYEVDLHDPSGTLVVRSQHHQSFLPDADPTGAVAFRDPGKKPGARRFVVPDGETFGGLARTITVEMCGEFFQATPTTTPTRTPRRSWDSAMSWWVGA